MVVPPLYANIIRGRELASMEVNLGHRPIEM